MDAVEVDEIQGSAEQKLLLCLMEQVNRLTDEISGTLANLKLTIDNAPNNSVEAKVAVWMHSADDRDMKITETREEMLTTKQRKKIRKKGYFLYEMRVGDAWHGVLPAHDLKAPQQYLLSRHRDRFSDSSLFSYHLTSN